jgi:hypothetical protein
MTLDEILKEIAARQLVAVRIAVPPLRQHDSYEGSVVDLLDTAAALGIRAIFVSVLPLDEDDFLHESEDDDDPDDDEPHSDEPVDLVACEPSLRRFRKHIGEHALFSVWITIGDATVMLDLETEWYTEFATKREETVDRLRDERDEASDRRADARQEESKRSQRELVRRIEALVEKPEFAALPSKAAMRLVVGHEEAKVSGPGRVRRPEPGG